MNAQATLTALIYNMPHAHYHRHSKIFPWDIEDRSRWERTTTSIGKLLGATRDHPVVAGVGYDHLISTVSLGCWAALRPITVEDIFAAVVPLYDKWGQVATRPQEQIAQDKIRGDPASTNSRGGLVNRKVTPNAKTNITSDEAAGTPGSRRRGRPRKAKGPPVEQHASAEESDDKTYEPTPGERAAPVGDAPAQGVDTEAAALAWGLIAVGGLGLGSAGVLGGEMLVR